MPRIEAIDPQDAQERTAQLLDGVQRRLGMTPNLIRTMAHSSATLSGYLDLSRALGRGALAAREREQIALAVAEIHGCDYCLATHSAMAKLVGLSELEVLDARRGLATSTRENAILVFAGELLARRGRVSDEVLRRVREGGLTEGEITEIVANVALHVFTNYLGEAARTEPDFPAAPVLETTNV
jgi:uncharacterized peroxidase-related enzyme